MFIPWLPAAAAAAARRGGIPARRCGGIGRRHGGIGRRPDAERRHRPMALKNLSVAETIEDDSLILAAHNV
jgi:hypothetical protein